MNLTEWNAKIKQACEDASTYRPYFDSVIETLSGILARRDEAEALFEKSGKAVVVEHTNKGGATNIEQNPLLRLINDLNRDALQYWKELGLTPAGLKRINEQAIKIVEKEPSALEKALMNFEKLE